MKVLRLTVLCVFLFVFFQSSNGQSKKDYVASDIATTIPIPYNYQSNKLYKGIEISNFYLKMRDGVEIAIDIYLPKGLKEDEKIPAILHQTRYWRSPDVRWPFSLFTNGLIGPMGSAIQKIVENGYAVVNVDTRGTGASFGNRKYPWSENEIKDGAEIVDWIIQQRWSNQNVGTIGVSYGGTAAEFLVVNQHPNVKSALVLYSLFNVYEDIAFPGGIYHDFLVENWGTFNERLDKNQYPRKSFLAKLLIKGVSRVRTKNRVQTIRAAVEDHHDNIQVNEMSTGLIFRDDQPSTEGAVKSEVFSPSTYIDEVNNSGAAIYAYSGWYDGDFQRAAIRKFLNYTNPQNKLLIGPWEHSGQYNCSPANSGPAGFDHIGEFIKFFDYHLKDIDNGLYNEPRVHYFTMGEEKWKSDDYWPPYSEVQTLYFDESNSLSDEISTADVASDTYRVDATAGTGDDSRWKSVIGMLKTGNVYPDREIQSQKLITYDSAPLEESIEVSGHPLITLYIVSTHEDGNFHVYLEDVDPEGSVSLITEGLLRGIHRKVSEEKPPYKIVAPYHSYLKKDALPLIPGEIAELHFDLIPTSYQFKKGHKIRISLSGADKDHFENVLAAEPVWEIYRSQEYPSKIELPVIN